MAVGTIEAIVAFGKTQYTLNDILGTLTHHRGWDYPSSYVIIELNNPHTEVINEFMNYGKFTVKYGKDGDYSGPFTFEIASVANEVQVSNVKVRILGVEPGFVRLAEKSVIRSYPNQTISGVLAQLAHESNIRTVGIKKTSGNYTFIQPNVSTMLFITQYLLPIATDSSKSAPYLFTIDNNVMHCRPPDLRQDPRFKFIIDSSKENVVKRFSLKNSGMETDMSTGTEYRTHGYDFTKKGGLSHKDYTKSVNQSFLNKKEYDSKFNRSRTMPYSEQWMLDAHNRNEIGRTQFVVSAEAILTGENELFFDQIYQFTNISFEKEPSEYSGKYYVQSIANTLKRRLFVSQLTLYTNAFLKGQKAPSASPSSEGAKPATTVPRVNSANIIT